MAKFCQNCGNELNENQDICLKCGVKVKNNSSSNNTPCSDLTNHCPPLVNDVEHTKLYASYGCLILEILLER